MDEPTVDTTGVDAAELDKRRRNDPRFYTADRRYITHGVRVWDYDLRAGTVWFTEREPDGKHWDGWFQVINDHGGTSIMNGERLCVRHPASGEHPPAPPADPARAVLVTAAETGVPLRLADETERDQVGEAAAFVEYDPRVPHDPTPWRTRHHRRYRTDQVQACPRTPTHVEAWVRANVPQVRDLSLTRHAVTGNVTLGMLRIDYGHAGDGRGQGYGTRALNLITEWADHQGVTLTTTPEPAHLAGEKRTGKKRLHAFYVRARFVNNRGRWPQYMDSMVREPATTEQETRQP